MDERLSWPGWLTHSGRFTDISGHPSATGRAQDRESTPTEDRRSTTEPRNQLERGKVRQPKTYVTAVPRKQLRCSLIVIIVAYLGPQTGFHACIVVRNKAVVDNENENARILSAFENRLRAGFV